MSQPTIGQFNHHIFSDSFFDKMVSCQSLCPPFSPLYNGILHSCHYHHTGFLLPLPKRLSPQILFFKLRHNVVFYLFYGTDFAIY